MKCIACYSIAAAALLQSAAWVPEVRALARPVIVVEKGVRKAVFEKIEKFEELREAYTALKPWPDEQVESHGEGPAALLDSIPAFGTCRSGHMNVLFILAKTQICLTKQKSISKRSNKK